MITYLALGDSYTIGESVPQTQRWPVQLAAALRREGFDVAEPTIVARTGWTTDELAAGIHQADPAGPFDLVSLLIGVNNQYRGWPVDTYQQEFTALLRRAIGFTAGSPGRVLILSIPDWGVTPFAAGREPGSIAAAIDAFNRANRAEAAAAGVRYVNVTPISRQAAQQPDLIAADGLHPSGKMYTAWVDLVLPQALAALRES